MGFHRMSILGFILAVLALGFLIAIHEAGHMMVARWSGMRVLRYSVGFGKVIWSKTKGETTYQLAMIPFGGFVEIDGMNPVEEHEDPNDPRLFDNRPIWSRIAVIVAGPVTNYLFAFLFAALLFGSLGQPEYKRDKLKPGVTLKKISKGKPAERAGIKSGDLLTHIDGYAIDSVATYKGYLITWKLGYRHEPDSKKRNALKRPTIKVRRDGKELTIRQPLDPETKLLGVVLVQLKKGGGLRVEKLERKPATTAKDGLKTGDVIHEANGRPIAKVDELKSVCMWAFEGFRWAGKERGEVRFTLKREGDTVHRDVSPNKHTGYIGVQLVENFKLTWKRQGFGKDAWAGLTFPVKKSREMLVGLKKLVTGDKRVRKGAAGPVGIVAYMKQEMVAGPDRALLIVIILSTLLGLFNLLPVPALDGGRVVFLLIAAITRRRINPHIEARIHFVGFALLLLLIALLTFRDIGRLFS
jgi:regulator of sigma E protease